MTQQENNMQIKRMFLLISLVLLAAACSTHKPMPAVDYVDIDRFMGDWYVIANIPTFIEKDAFNPVETYERDPDGTIATTFTFNQGSLDGPVKVYQPRGYIKDTVSNAVWGMQFVWPIKADYRIVYLDENYQQTIIGRNSRDYVWVMARSPNISDADYIALVSRVNALGYDLGELKKAVHLLPKALIQRSTKLPQISYSAITLGSVDEVNIYGGKLNVASNGSLIGQQSLSQDQRRQLKDILNNLDLTSIETLEIPSKRHQFDGAKLATLVIKSGGISYSSRTFDDDNPPSELRALVTFLQAQQNDHRLELMAP
jgi:apolipoprotein D and lipocalin family protein